MQAVILAAGKGSRLNGTTNGLPKCLLKVGGQAIIEHQLEALSEAGIGEILIVTGYKAEEIRKVVGNQVEYRNNDRYDKTNSLYSLSLASNWVKGPFVLMNCDVLFEPEVLHKLVAKSGNALAYDSTAATGQEQTKVAMREGRIIDLGKDLPKELARGESLGILCFDSKGSQELFSRVKALVQNGGAKSWVMEAVRIICNSIFIRGVNVAGLPWVEIDFPYDFNRAQKEVWPAIYKNRWKKTIRWRKIKWFAGGIAAMLLITIGLFAGFELFNQSTTWSTVLPVNGQELQLTMPDGVQRWWVAPKDDTIKAEVRGPSTLRVEVRLILASLDRDIEQYIVETALDGKVNRWEVFKATPDEVPISPELYFGDRDRIEIEVPSGNHTLGVSLLAGECNQFLTRIRYPEVETDEDDDEQ